MPDVLPLRHGRHDAADAAGEVDDAREVEAPEHPTSGARALGEREREARILAGRLFGRAMLAAKASDEQVAAAWARAAGRESLTRQLVDRVRHGEKALPVERLLVLLDEPRLAGIPERFAEYVSALADARGSGSEQPIEICALTISRRVGELSAEIVDAAADRTIDGEERSRIEARLDAAELAIRKARRALGTSTS